MKVRVFILFAVLTFTLATAINSLATSPEPVGGEERSSIEYANLDGSTLKIFDSTANTYTTWAFPRPAIRDRSGNSVADTSVTEYFDCSTAQLVCADFEELALAVPRIIGGESRWKYEDWTFEKTSCLRRQKSECDRIAVSFGSVAENVVGGFVFDRKSGIEMYFFENRKFKDSTRIYVRVSDKGLFR